MKPRREPLLWLQCLALGAIPLELLLVRQFLAGADPGPFPGIERLLVWGIGILAPAIALWQRPADWGSLLFARIPIAVRNSEQNRLSAGQGGLISRLPLVVVTVVLIPVLWWLDDTAVLASEFSPLHDRSRLTTLLLSVPVLAVMVWQVQQLGQSLSWLLLPGPGDDSQDGTFNADQLKERISSFGLPLIQLSALDWPEPETVASEEISEQGELSVPTTPVEPEKTGKNQQGSTLDGEVLDANDLPSGDAEAHGEQTESRGSEQSEPNETAEASPGGH